MGWVLGEVNARFDVNLSGTAPGTGHITHHYGNSADAKPVGLAWGTVARGEAKAAGDCLAHWLAGNWRNLGIDYVIWYGRLFNPRRLSVNGGWRAYCNPQGCSGATRQHYDHVHIQVTGDPGRPQWW